MISETTSINYFKHPAVSNSNLTDLMLKYIGEVDDIQEYTGIMDFGSLVDAFLTTPLRVQYWNYSLLSEDGRVIQFNKDVFKFAQDLADRAKKDPLIAAMVSQMKGQYIFVRTLGFSYDGSDYTLQGKCKFDQFSRTLQMGADYKTTACKTRKAFLDAVNFFDWDRQAAWYMDLARIDRHWIIGLSKTTGELFKIAIQRGDAMYNSGLVKYQRLAYLWSMLLEDFKN